MIRIEIKLATNAGFSCFVSEVSKTGAIADVLKNKTYFVDLLHAESLGLITFDMKFNQCQAQSRFVGCWSAFVDEISCILDNYQAVF